MAALNTKPNSSSKRQHQALVIEVQRHGLDLSEIRKMVGGSLCRLSAREASDWIERFSGQGLPNPPGQKKSPYAGKKPTDATRMITPDQIEQIERMARDYFGGKDDAARAWLHKNFKAAHPRELLTAQRAGEVIATLKRMCTRRCNADRRTSPVR